MIIHLKQFSIVKQNFKNSEIKKIKLIDIIILNPTQGLLIKSCRIRMVFVIHVYMEFHTI